MDCIWVNLKNVGPTFFEVYIKTSFIQLENHLISVCGRDFANERLSLSANLKFRSRNYQTLIFSSGCERCKHSCHLSAGSLCPSLSN